MKTFRTPVEQRVRSEMARIFAKSNEPIEVRLETFPKYVRRQNLTRFLALYEIFRKVLPVKGSVIECGVWHGFGLMTWAKLSAILEPTNLTRRIYGFDTFEGFPSAEHAKDSNKISAASRGDLRAAPPQEIEELVALYDEDRFLGHIQKVQLVKGDAIETMPKFLAENPHLIVSLLFLDFDLFEPTKVALETFVPRMPKGAVIAFDELDNPIWPGETLALLETMGINSLRIERLEFDPYIGYCRIG